MTNLLKRPRVTFASVDPRPVIGQREYSLILEGQTATIQAAHADARKLIETAGASFAEETSGRIVFTRPDPHGEIAVSLRPLGAKARALELRIRPDEVDHSNYWPPVQLRRVAAQLVRSHELYDGATRLRSTPATLGPMDLKSWMDGVLFDADRQLPFIVLTPGRHTTPEIAAEVAEDLAGIANVYVFHDSDLAKNFSYSVTKERGVFGGAVRIYRAGFTMECDPLDHDLLVPSYLDRRLALGRGLGEELARRLLPLRGDPIERPRPERPALPPPELPIVVRKKRPEDRLHELEELLDAVEQRNEELEEENRRLNAALRAQADQLRRLENRPARPNERMTSLVGLPWPLENPDDREIELSDRFADDVATIARDRSLSEEVRKKMENALRHPEDYGKDMRGARKGQRACYVARNYRLVWSLEGRKVRFVLIVSKEDPEYSPHGA